MRFVGTILGGWATSLIAQSTTAPPTAPVAAPSPAPAATPAAPRAASSGTIRSISVSGAERLEAEAIRSYANLSPGQTYTAETLDTALKILYATELFADVQFLGADTGAFIIQVRENPVINRVVLEGNKRIKDDKIQPEIRSAPRQIFTRSKVRTDVGRIIELYKRQGRFAVTVEPKVVQLDQNRIDLVFEITEGDKSKVRAINIIGNEQFSDGTLQKEMYANEAGGLFGIVKQNDSYDPDRLAAVFALFDKNEWCPGGSVYLDLQTGSFLLYPRLVQVACADSKTQAPVEQGTLSEAPLQALRSAYAQARRAGLRRDDCAMVVSNGGPEALVITGPAFSGTTPENVGCWSKEADALHDKLFQLFGRQRQPQK